MKRYVHEKIAFVQQHRPDDEHILIVPGAQTEVKTNERSRIYSIASPLVSRAAQYRILLNLREVDEIIERERPDIIESGDPYQVGWQALRSARSRGIPAVAYYHSHFAEAYLRRPAERFGAGVSRGVMNAARTYTRNLYRGFDATLVPSGGLCDVLRSWGLTNVRQAELGVNIEMFQPAADRAVTRDSLGVSNDRILLLYVGRLSPEKNTRTLFEAFRLLPEDRFHLLVIGEGPERDQLDAVRKTGEAVSWISYCADAPQLARYYRAADFLVHPGVEETFGLVALESQACGTPVLGIRGSFMDEVILHDQSAWATENSGPALAAAIEQMSSTQDLRALGAEACDRVRERYAWPAVFERLFSIYRDVGAT
ncbi:MAG: glycosyltransferase [Chthoniobacterales bacterium]